MKRAEDQHHRRLMHLLDVHWYPEAKGSKRITDKDVSPKTVAARLQAPRSLWDPTYVGEELDRRHLGQADPAAALAQGARRRQLPGTELAMTEYNYGVGDHISGGLAQADVLGVLGREGVYLATYWGDGAGNGPLPGYIKSAFQLFRNYDGKGGTYADTAVAATPGTPGDLDKASIFAAIDSKRAGLLTVLVINKDQHSAFNGKIEITSESQGRALLQGRGVRLRRQRRRGAARCRRPTSANNQIAYRLPPLSATLFVCRR